MKGSWDFIIGYELGLYGLLKNSLEIIIKYRFDFF